MISKIFSVHDCKANAFIQPFFASTSGVAKRQFEEAVNSEGHAFGTHAGDFTLFELGQYNDLDASFKLHASPVSLGLAITFRRDELGGSPLPMQQIEPEAR